MLKNISIILMLLVFFSCKESKKNVNITPSMNSSEFCEQIENDGFYTYNVFCSSNKTYKIKALDVNGNNDYFLLFKIPNLDVEHPIAINRDHFTYYTIENRLKNIVGNYRYHNIEVILTNGEIHKFNCTHYNTWNGYICFKDKNYSDGASHENRVFNSQYVEKFELLD